MSNVVIGIFSPSKYLIEKYKGYDIKKFGNRIRFIEILCNRDGEMGGICPLFFDGAVCHFHELGLPTDKDSLSKEYEYLKKIRNTKPISNTKSFFAYKFNKKEKSLHRKTILSKFAALFNKIIKKTLN